MARPSANLVRFYSLNLFLSAGLFLADALSETLFLSTFGVRYLPAGLIGTAVLSVLFTYLITRYLYNWEPYQLLLPLTISGILLALIIWVGLLFESQLAVAIFFLAFRPIRDQLAAQIWNFFAKQYDAQQAKRYFPILGSAGRFGAIIGYLVLLFVVNWFGTAASLLAWTLLFALAILILWRSHTPSASRTAAKEKPTNAGKPLSREALRQYPLILYILGYSVLTIILVFLLTYQVGATLVVAYPEASELSTIYAIVGIVSNIVLWIFQVTLLPRIIRRFSLPTTNLLFPAFALSIGVWISAAASVPAAVFGQVTRTTLRQALHIPVEDLLFNALPQAYKASTRTLLRGAIIPLGAVLTGLMLMGLQAVSWGGWLILGLTILIGAGNLILAFFTSRHYRSATLALVQEENFVLQRLALTGFGTATAEARQVLVSRLTQAHTLEEIIFLAEVLIETGAEEASQPLSQKLVTADPETQIALLEVMQQSGVGGPHLTHLQPTLLASPHRGVRQATLQWLNSLSQPPLAGVDKYVQDEDGAVRLAAIDLLVNKGTAYQRAQAGQALHELLTTTADTHLLTAALQLLPHFDPAQLLPYFQDAQPQMREAAVQAAVHIPPTQHPLGFVAALHHAAQDDTEAVRQAALRAIATLDTADSLPLLQTALADPSPAVRQVAINSLVALGSPTIPPLRHQLAQATSDIEQEAVLSTLAQLLPLHRLPELAEFEKTSLAKAYEIALLQHALQPVHGPAGELLLADLGDALTAVIQRLYRLIGATSGADTATAIQFGLRHPDKHHQAQALEALEVARSPEYAFLLGALAHPDKADRLQQMGQQYLNLILPTHLEAWIQVLQDPSEWRHALVTAAKAEQQDPAVAASRIAISVMAERGDQTSVLSVIEKAIFLKAVPSFTSMTTDQLRILATAAEEVTHTAGETIFEMGDPSDSMMIIVSGRVGIESKRGRSFVRIETLNPKDSFGEFTVFDAQPRTARTIAVDDCLLLVIRRDVLLDLIRRYPDMAFEIIKFLSHRLRDTMGKMAEKTRAHTRGVMDLFDKFDE